MKKTLYSLMLSDEVIHEIDLLAHQMGTNRSNLVNQILAERVSLKTPEQRVGDVFAAIEELMSKSREIIPQLTPNAPTMALRSCLEYKYRPTFRYEVELSEAIPARDKPIGTLSVVFRTQSLTLLGSLKIFFKLWCEIESSLLPSPVKYSLGEGSFTRTLAYPSVNAGAPRSLTSKELAAVISDYIRLLDRLLKGYVAGDFSTGEVADEYLAEYKKREIII